MIFISNDLVLAGLVKTLSSILSVLFICWVFHLLFSRWPLFFRVGDGEFYHCVLIYITHRDFFKHVSIFNTLDNINHVLNSKYLFNQTYIQAFGGLIFLPLKFGVMAYSKVLKTLKNK